MFTQDEPSETRLVLVGKAGSGKSSTGNTILGQNIFPVGNRFARAAPTSQKSVSNQQISVQVLDTPGFFDTELNETEVAVQLVKAIQSSQSTPCVPLFVIKIGGFTNEDARAFRRLKALFDSEISQYTVVVFTHGDYLDQGHTSLEKLLAESPEQLQEILQECDHRYVVFNNKAQDPEKKTQVEKLVVAVHELNKKHGGKPFITPYLSGLEETIIRELSERRLNTFRVAELREETLQLKCDQLTKDKSAKRREHWVPDIPVDFDKREQSTVRSFLIKLAALFVIMAVGLDPFTQSITSTAL